MIASHDNVSMALFCDFENVALGVRDAHYEKFDIRLVLERLLLKGSIVIKKAYCDWDRYKPFKAPMHEANFELIEIPHVRQSGKNSADIRLVVDALDLCYTKSHVNTFVIISGDSDFSPLVSKLRENAKHVIGVGVKHSTSDLLIANCDEFIFYDDLVRENARTSARGASRESTNGRRGGGGDDRRRKEDVEARKTQAIDIAVETFEALMAERGDSGKIWASALKDAIKRRKPDFNESYYGFRAFGNLLEEAQSRGLLDVGRDEKSGTYVYRASLGGDGVRDLREPTMNEGRMAPMLPMAAETSLAAPTEQAPAETSAPAAQDKPKRSSRRRTRSSGGAAADVPSDMNVVREDAAPATEAIEAPAAIDAIEAIEATAPSRASSAKRSTAPANDAPPEAVQGEEPAKPKARAARKTPARPRRPRKTTPSTGET
ncbi:NYN domain-containing protein [Bordetella genomosp. 9]|uniref:NYN domain-containing protein n=1 Tax=Bordetella genomosp. 9 TaxID=1416803 RepID=A0A261R797_9BORD|nr:NYN domain-containing protein [Bordetella genomosp. 9]OZI20233.1 NYN domain-containing protein [Bordetella genomosp. 9]